VRAEKSLFSKKIHGLKFKKGSQNNCVPQILYTERLRWAAHVNRMDTKRIVKKSNLTLILLMWRIG
jgi:hypothetical protein